MRLTPAQVAEAITWNRHWESKLGWKKHREKIAKVLRIPPLSTEDRFAQAVADFQAGKHGTLEIDGIIGPNTWKRLKPTVGSAAGSPPPSSSAGPRWLHYAHSEMLRWYNELDRTGNDPDDAEKHVSWDEEYFTAAPYFGGHRHADGETPKAGRNPHWCAAFVNWCLHRAGFSHTGSAFQGSFLNNQKRANRWRFDALETPRMGCVLVMGGSNSDHIGFLWSEVGLPRNPKGNVQLRRSGRTVWVLGGNQSNRVTISDPKIAHTTLFATNGDNGIVSPYLWPRRGESTCSIGSVATEQEHFCALNPV